MFASFRRGGVWKYLIPLLVVLFVCGGGLAWLGSLILYTGPAVPRRDYVADHRAVALAALERDAATNDADWAAVTALIAAAETAFADSPSGRFDSDVFRPDEFASVDAPQIGPTAEDYIQAFRDARGDELLDAVREAVELRGPPVRVLKDQSRITIDSVDLRDISVAREIARMLVYRARTHQQDGEWEDAIQTLFLLRAVVMVYQAQNTLIERLVGLAIEHLLHETIQQSATYRQVVGLEELDDLAAIEHCWPRSTASVLDGERLWILGTFQDTLGDSRIYPLSYSAQANAVNEYFDVLIRLADGDEFAVEEQQAMMARITQNWKYAPTEVMLPALTKFLGAEDRVTRIREQTALVLAIERHRRVNGALPETLADIADPPGYDSGFVYVTTEDEPGYIVGHPAHYGSMPPVGAEPQGG